MSAAPISTATRAPWLGGVRLAYLACVVVFGWAVAQFYSPVTGFTSLIMIGDAIEARQVSQLRDTPHHVYEDSAGYDGAYYVQLALNPTLQNPELPNAIDNFQYRARRILFSWTAWAAGLGRPEWIMQAFALLNVAAWLALAVVLLRWFPATSWENFFRWFGVMASHGLIMSVRDSLVDGPALLLVALALAAWEDGKKIRAAVWLALAGLGRETSLLVTAIGVEAGGRGEAGGGRREAGGKSPAGSGVRGLRSLVPSLWSFVFAALPLLAWVIYLRLKFGTPSETGLNNFTLPLAGFVEKWRATLASVASRSEPTAAWTTLAVLVGLTVQALFFALRWRPREAAWRVGVVFVGLMLFLATPVWEGFPGAAGRALLPMTLAFNLLVPRDRRWLAVLLAGNLTVVAAWSEFTPPREFYSLQASGDLVATVKVDRVAGWFGVEESSGAVWRWSSGESALRIRNSSGHPITLVCEGRAASVAGARRLRISAGPADGIRKNDAMVWSGELAPEPEAFQFGVTVAPGETMLTFTSDPSGQHIGSDPRSLAFKVLNLRIVAKPAAGSP